MNTIYKHMMMLGLLAGLTLGAGTITHAAPAKAKVNKGQHNQKVMACCKSTGNGKPAMACCKPGAACCKAGAKCCKLTLSTNTAPSCCTPGAACCKSVPTAKTSKGARPSNRRKTGAACCASKGQRRNTCCKPGASCCKR